MATNYDHGQRADPIKIKDRAFAYAVRAVHLMRFLNGRRDPAGSIIARQYLRSAMSIGANVEEAQAAESLADFAHKMAISQKEARESLYWLRLLQASKIVPSERLNALISETSEVLSILSKIVVTTKNRMRAKAGKPDNPSL